MTDPPPRHVYLVDGSGFIFRAFFGTKTRMTRPDGTPTNAVYSFTRMLMKLIADTDADHVAVIFDKARRTFRNDIYPDYKAHRPEPPEDLVPQFALIREAVAAFNVACLDHDGFEADDLIATYARMARERGADVTIVSSDKDLMQLVDDRVSLWDAMKNQVIGPEQVREKFGVGPDKVIDVQALAGDASDNVPGVAGIGLKTAAELITRYGDLDTLLERAAEIKQPKRRERLIEQAELARISRRLVTLCDTVPVAVPLEDMKVRRADPQRLLAFLEAQAFKSLLPKVTGDLTANGDLARAVETEAVNAARDYELVTDPARLDAWIAEATRAGRVAVDTETTGLDPLRAGLVGVSLAVRPGHACYVPLAHRAPGDQGDLFGDGGDEAAAPDQIPLEDAVARLKPLLEDPSVLKIGQNLKYDMQVLARHGIAVAPIDDTMLLSYVLDGGLHGHGMDELADLHLGVQTVKFSDVAGSGRKQVTFDRVPLDKALDYAAEDADVTLRLHGVLKPRLVAERMVTVYETLERPLVPVLRRMEAAGIKVDAGLLRDLSVDFAARLGDLEQEVHRLAGREFNVGSPKQLGEVLFDEMGLPGGRKGKTGAYATGAQVLEDLAAQGHDLPRRVLDWRQLAKLKSTYTDALLEDINPDTGRVHTSFAQTGAATGRLASSDPNLQNIPIRTEEGRKLRRAFVAEDGHVLLSADYSQIELRLLAHAADVTTLKEAFHAGIDIHALTASQVFDLPVEGMDPMVRRRAKAINFGIIYGISAFGLARQLGIERGEAARYIDAYFERYPGIRAYMERTVAFAAEHGFVQTPFGRRVHVPGLKEKNPNARGFAERAAINAPIQGGAADIIKRAMIRIPDALADTGLGARMLLQVHDELIFEVPEDECEATRESVRAVMESAAQLSVPLVVDSGAGATWADAH